MVGDIVVVASARPAESLANFCPDPVGFCSDPKRTLSRSVPTPSPPPCDRMGSCYAKCMEPDAASLTTKRVNKAAAAMQTLDLEELHTTAVEAEPERRLVVDYEDSDGEHPQPRESGAGCAPQACGLLEEATATRRRSRAGSDLKGKSTVFEAESSASATDEEEEPARCSAVHKLCMCEVQLHRSLESCWMVCSDQVYDVTGLVTSHPGGVRSILRKAGGPDCARDMKFHSKKARKMMEKCFIGKLQPCGDVECADDGACSIM